MSPAARGLSGKRGFLVLLGLAALVACANVELEQAFEGEFPTEKNNNVIIGYCQSCHIHKDFDSEEHVARVRENYNRTYFRKASECRTCHYLEKDWVHNNFKRKTRMPSRSKSAE